MSNKIYLEDIVKKKKQRIVDKNYDKDKLINKIKTISKRPSFYEAMKKNGLSIIGEIKKASPSKGLIRDNFIPLELGKLYEQSVDAISILTEEDYFLGKDEYLKTVSDNNKLPTLCKDFIINSNQIYNAKSLGASCILLIVAILTSDQLKEYINIANSLGLDVLVETHTREEIDRAIEIGAKIIGINNRDLKTFETNIDKTIELRKYVPDNILVISESGINTVDDIVKLKQVKIDGILVGESFMRCDDIVKQGEAFKNAYN
jgi:indole-3-glycerol phosphate synthase